jgi:hypothetical protein
VTALQVVIWNAGKEAIRSENLLTPITLTTSPTVPILEARIKQVGRTVSQIGLDTSQIGKGSVGVTWKILEHYDGAVLQLIAAGPTTVTVKAEGVVEGQQNGIKVYDTGGSVERPSRVFLFGLLGLLTLHRFSRFWIRRWSVR